MTDTLHTAPKGHSRCRKAHLNTVEPQVESPILKHCSKCGRDKPIQEFYRQKAAKDGHNSICKLCASAYIAKYQKTHRREINAAARRRYHRGAPVRYCECGAVLSHGNQLLCPSCGAQGSVRYCPLCGSPLPPGMRLDVCVDCWERQHSNRCGSCGKVIPPRRKTCDECLLARLLPWPYRRRLITAGIRLQRVTEAAEKRQPRGKPVSRQYVFQVINRQVACPEWLRRLLDEMLAERVATRRAE